MGRLYPSNPIVGVGVIILRDNSILLVKRAQEPGKGRWSIPGGLVKIGETVREAVLREAKEETNLNLTLGEVADIFDYIQRDDKGTIKYHYVIIDFYVSEFTGDAKAGSDALDIKWVNINEVYNYPLTSTTKLLIQKIEKQEIKN
jgi:8-oxo-dGTP diphosphatase